MRPFETVRAFVALNLDIAGVRRVAEVMTKLRALADAPPAPSLHWVPPTKLHVTLKFFGQIDRAIVPAIRGELDTLAKELAAPRLSFGGFGAFPNDEQARVLFATTDDIEGKTASLAARIDEIAEGLGLTVSRDPRAYVPHLTLARAKEPVALRPFVSRMPTWRVSVTAAEMVLYRSDTPTDAGAEYDALARFAFRG